jgi:preprotein translocase subunit SecD
MASRRPELKVIRGKGSEGPPAERIALSLVHKRERIDIPVSAVVRIEAHAELIVSVRETRQVLAFSEPRVEVWLNQAIRGRISRLSREIIDEPLDIIVGGERISSPIVREPLCSQGCFVISVHDVSEAHALAQRMRTGWITAGPRPVP